MVTKIRIEPGNCKMVTVASVEKNQNRELVISVDCECKNLVAFKDAIKTVNMQKYGDILKASSLIPHCICPIPMGVIKACEVEMGLGLKKDVKFEFITEDK
jgi:hypothetical protein